MQDPNDDREPPNAPPALSPREIGIVMVRAILSMEEMSIEQNLLLRSYLEEFLREVTVATGTEALTRDEMIASLVRIIWYGDTPPKKLTSLQSQIETACLRFGQVVSKEPLLDQFHNLAFDLTAYFSPSSIQGEGPWYNHAERFKALQLASDLTRAKIIQNYLEVDTSILARLADQILCHKLWGLLNIEANIEIRVGEIIEPVLRKLARYCQANNTKDINEVLEDFGDSLQF